jgi:hypothetical protein
MRIFTRIMLTGVFLVLVPGIAFSAYLIELKNGTQFVTGHYWEEGDQVKFNLYGGTAGFNRDIIKSIQKTDKPYDYEEPEAKPEEEQAAAPEAETPTGGAIAPKAATPEIPPITEDQKFIFLGQKENIKSGMNEVDAAFRTARENSDTKGMRAQREKLLKYHDEIQGLFEEVKKANNGKAPDWWPSVWHSPPSGNPSLTPNN